MNKVKVIGSIAAGVGIGFLAGVLLAPEKGSDLRGKISKKSVATLDEVKLKLNEIVTILAGKAAIAKAEAVAFYEEGKKEIDSQLS